MTHQEIVEEIAEWEKLKAKAEQLAASDEFCRFSLGYQEAIRQANMNLYSLKRMLDLA
jgi:hypothetical protein